ncbi:MAG: translocation/assembly module TamB domain-containing protein, partial [Acetobacteraceae bacterium]
GTLTIAGLAAAGASLQSIRADFTGNAGQANIKAQIDGLRIPGPAPDLFADKPFALDVSARLDQPDRPVQFALTHALLSATGSARTGGAPSADVILTIPALAPFAKLGWVDLTGRTRLAIKAAQSGDRIDATVAGEVGITDGMAPVPALIGDKGTIDVSVSIVGTNVTLRKAAVAGHGLAISAEGGLVDDRLTLDWTTRLTDLAAVQPSVSGPLEAKGHVEGKLDDLTLAAVVQGDLAAQGYRSGHFAVRVDAAGLPKTPHGKITADGTLLDSPVVLSATADRRDDGTLHVVIDHSTWKSLAAEGDLTLPGGAVVPTGTVSLEMRQLADLTPLVGQAVTGHLKADLKVNSQQASLIADLQNARLAGSASLAAMRLALDVRDPMGQPALDGSVTLDGVRAAGVAANGRVTAKGTLDALALDVTSRIDGLAGATAQVATAGVLDATGKSLSLQRLQATWKQETLRLLAPVRIGFAQDITLDRLRLGFRQAEFSASGRVGSTLDLTASLRNLPADIAAILDPTYAADGTIGAEARLSGTPARPQGTVKVTANRLHLRKGPGQALPPATITANAQLAGDRATIDTRATMGKSTLTVTGAAPLSATGPLDLRARGKVDLAVTDPLLSPQGRRARGTIELDAGVTGQATAPRVAGTLQLTNGEVQDLAMGARISDLSALLRGDGDTIRIMRFTGKAGQGTIDASGTLGLADSMPINLRLQARNARPLSSDLLTAVLDADLTLAGAVLDQMNLGGTITVQRADIRIPERLPTSIATIPVRVAGAPVPTAPPPRPAPPLGLNLTLNAPGQIFIRGRGVDAELGGRVVFAGTAANPVPSGGLSLRRGTFSLAGQTLNFTEGTVDFSGGGLTNPALRLVATSVTSALTARLTVSGSARNPKISLSSIPDMPQDEILAQLLFNSTKARLSPFQIAQVASALASMAGGPSLIDSPLNDIRNSLGLDRLTVGAGDKGQPTLEAGSYIAPGVYLGARQSVSGSGTQATIQIDIAKGLKLEATAGTGSTSATGSTGAADAASVGVTYQLEY